MIPRFLRAMFAAKTTEPETQTMDDLVDELASIQKQAVREIEEPEPSIRWGCPECQGEWYCGAYTRECPPPHCAYCGAKYAPPGQCGLKNANFRDERKEKA